MYVENKGGTLRLTKDLKYLQYANQDVQNRAMKSQFAGGGTQGKINMGGI